MQYDGTVDFEKGIRPTAGVALTGGLIPIFAVEIVHIAQKTTGVAPITLHHIGGKATLVALVDPGFKTYGYPLHIGVATEEMFEKGEEGIGRKGIAGRYGVDKVLAGHLHVFHFSVDIQHRLVEFQIGLVMPIGKHLTLCKQKACAEGTDKDNKRSEQDNQSDSCTKGLANVKFIPISHYLFCLKVLSDSYDGHKYTNNI